MQIISVRTSMFLAALALLTLGEMQPVAAAVPLKQYVCRVDAGPLTGQAVLITAATSPGMNHPCSDAQGNSGRVIFEFTAEIRQYVCDFANGPLAGQLKILSGATLPAMNAACDDGAGNTGTVVFIEPASSPTPAPVPANSVACVETGTNGPWLKRCPPPTGTTSHVCRNLEGDPNNCNGCDVRCAGQTAMCRSRGCVASAAGTSCTAPMRTCPVQGGGVMCRNVLSDPNNCGQCGTQCTNAQVCVQGQCKIAEGI